MQLVGVRKAFRFDPGSFVESHGIDNQHIAFPSTNGMSRVCGLEVFRMPAPIHINDAKTVWPAYIENENPVEIAHFDDLETISRSYLTWARRWLAAGVWRVTFKIGLTIVVEFAGPRLKWNIRHR